MYFACRPYGGGEMGKITDAEKYEAMKKAIIKVTP